MARRDRRDEVALKTRVATDMDEKSLFTKFWTNESKTTRKVLARIPEGSDYRPDPKSRTAQRDRLADRLRGEDDHRRAREREGGVGAAADACDDEGRARRVREAERRHGRSAGRRCPTAAGTARSSSSAGSGPLRRWPGASSSTSSITAARSRRICGRWDRRCRRSTDRAATSRRPERYRRFPAGPTCCTLGAP